MRVLLMNSAVMPQPGKYEAVRISREEFIFELKKAWEKGILKSYIGYEENIKRIAKWANVRVPFSRDQVTSLKPGDIMLVMKLKYRLPDPGMKKGPQNFISDDDFEFFRVVYSGA